MACKQSIIVITGPTATGKTPLGIEVAQRVKGEIISVDSRQIYRYMDIGTAKPTVAERGRVGHHFVDIKNPDESYSAGRFGLEARRLIEELSARGTPPVLVGGSGLYLRAVLDGFFSDESDHTPTRIHLRRRLEREGSEALYAELGRLDPLSQARLEPKDVQRILRALEVAYDGGASLSAHFQRQTREEVCWTPLIFCLSMERSALYRRIDQRVERMLGQGLVDEVRALVEMGYDERSCALATLGYREILAHLRGRFSLKEAVERIKRGSRHYAKRQWTWFRKDRRLRWLDVGLWGMDGVFERVMAQYKAGAQRRITGC